MSKRKGIKKALLASVAMLAAAIFGGCAAPRVITSVVPTGGRSHQLEIRDEYTLSSKGALGFDAKGSVIGISEGSIYREDPLSRGVEKLKSRKSGVAALTQDGSYILFVKDNKISLASTSGKADIVHNTAGNAIGTAVSSVGGKTRYITYVTEQAGEITAHIYDIEKDKLVSYNASDYLAAFPWIDVKKIDIKWISYIEEKYYAGLIKLNGDYYLLASDESDPSSVIVCKASSDMPKAAGSYIYYADRRGRLMELDLAAKTERCVCERVKSFSGSKGRVSYICSSADEPGEKLYIENTGGTKRTFVDIRTGITGCVLSNNGNMLLVSYKEGGTQQESFAVYRIGEY